MQAHEIRQALESGKTVQVYDRSDAPKKIWKSAYKLADRERNLVQSAVYISRNGGFNWVVISSESIFRLKLSSCVEIIMREHFEGCEVRIK